MSPPVAAAVAPERIALSTRALPVKPFVSWPIPTPIAALVIAVFGSAPAATLAAALITAPPIAVAVAAVVAPNAVPIT